MKMNKRTKIGKAIAALITLLADACDMRQVWSAKRQAFSALVSAEKKMSWNEVCECNISIYAAFDSAEKRVKGCNIFAQSYLRAQA